MQAVPNSVVLNGSTPTMVTVKVTAADGSAGLTLPGGFSTANTKLAIWLSLCGLSGPGLVGTSGAGRRDCWRRVLYRLALVCLLPLGVILSAPRRRERRWNRNASHVQSHSHGNFCVRLNQADSPHEPYFDRTVTRGFPAQVAGHSAI